MTNKNKKQLSQNTINLVYGVEFTSTDENDYGETFFIYNTIFRNVHQNKNVYLNSIKDRVKKYCDKNLEETATNFTGNTKVEVVLGEDYYRTYAEVFELDSDEGQDYNLSDDYGQTYNTRQFFKRDYNPKITELYNQKRRIKAA